LSSELDEGTDAESFSETLEFPAKVAVTNDEISHVRIPLAQGWQGPNDLILALVALTPAKPRNGEQSAAARKIASNK
jgi:hypothetical protein